MSKSFYAMSREPGFKPYQPVVLPSTISLRGGTAVPAVQIYPGGIVAVNRCIHCHKMLKLGCPPILGTILGGDASRPYAS